MSKIIELDQQFGFGVRKQCKACAFLATLPPDEQADWRELSGKDETTGKWRRSTYHLHKILVAMGAEMTEKSVRNHRDNGHV